MWEEYNKPKKENRFLIRFYTKERLDQFLNSGRIWFPRADTFGDKMECVGINDLKNTTVNLKNLESRKQRHLISCWHNSTKESIAMWDTSFKRKEDQRVYALRFQYQELIDYVTKSDIDFGTKNNIVKRHYGRVVYKNLIGSRELDQNRMRRVAFRKESAFRYEQEFRFVFQSDSVFQERGYSLFIGDPSELNYEILVNPLLEHDDYNKCLIDLRSNIVGRVKHKDSTLVKWLKPSQW
tara:strand:- start:5121 stop:5834 length:714 start_codon:yes stop_codon:yes gene_type:complete